jgi:hypothetical protein
MILKHVIATALDRFDDLTVFNFLFTELAFLDRFKAAQVCFTLQSPSQLRR